MSGEGPDKPTFRQVPKEIVKELRTRYRADQTLTIRELAEEFGCRVGDVAAVVRGKRFLHAGGTPTYTLRPEPGLKNTK